MSIQLHGIRVHSSAPREPRQAEQRSSTTSSQFGSALREAIRPGTASTPRLERTDGDGRELPGSGNDAETPTSPGSSRNLAVAGNEVRSRGTLSEDPRTAGMYVPPDFYHGTSYSPVFDHQDENGNWVPTPRFEGQKIWGPWRGSLPDDFDPNARVEHDPLKNKQGPDYWKQDENGNWVLRETGYGGIPLNDDGTPRFTPDPSEFPEYFVTPPEEPEEA
jgi:hypothetical protein